MGLRFRKSITLCKGVKLNFGKTGASITTGVKGFHKTYNFNTGKTTTSIGIPGTGLYYTETSDSKIKKDKSTKSSNNIQSTLNTANYGNTGNYRSDSIVSRNNIMKNTEEKITFKESKITITDETIETIYRICDEKIDWFEFLSSATPTNPWVSEQLWIYLHSVALKVCENNHDAILDVIEKLNPYDDLLDYCTDFECGFDEENILKVGFEINKDIILNQKQEKNLINACIIRVIRDTFSLLPIDNVNIIVYKNDNIVCSFIVSANSFQNIKFRFANIEDIIKILK